ncbi:MFS transporter [Cryobacterium sp. RTC2.1]|uniref:MFS transporter n=1 Tax=Cryobacterium sp. RTC2.1 TaxID=3048634 RepID=UPI002B23AD77|nr:MFS transporter [Cryobacterium sp. RTC2.1]MEB0003500.1 MFS transporter [Cryobacterium sp. RTC2.1]
MLAAQGISLAGNAITMIVVPIYVLQETRSVLATGVAGVFVTVPVILGGALGGVLVDRLGFRTSAIIADIASGLTVLLIPILATTVGLPFWALLSLVFFSGLLDTPGTTAKSALLPDLAEGALLRLARANGAQSAISRSATMIGASVAALSLVWLGALNSLLLDAATFAASALVLWICLPRSKRVASAQPTRPSELKPGYWQDFSVGARFLVASPLLRGIVLLVVVTNCIDSAGLIVLFPVYARTVTPDGALLAGMVAFFAGGALTGSSLFGWFGHQLPRRGTLVLSFLLAGAPPYLAMAAGVDAPVLLAVFALAGLAAGSINPLLSTILYERVPREMRARVLGGMTTGVAVGMPIGSLLGGVLVSQTGLVPTLIATGVAYAAITLTPLIGRSWVDLEARNLSDELLPTVSTTMPNT